MQNVFLCLAIICLVMGATLFELAGNPTNSLQPGDRPIVACIGGFALALGVLLLGNVFGMNMELNTVPLQY